MYLHVRGRIAVYSFRAIKQVKYHDFASHVLLFTLPHILI